MPHGTSNAEILRPVLKIFILLNQDPELEKLHAARIAAMQVSLSQRNRWKKWDAAKYNVHKQPEISKVRWWSGQLRGQWKQSDIERSLNFMKCFQIKTWKVGRQKSGLKARRFRAITQLSSAKNGGKDWSSNTYFFHTSSVIGVGFQMLWHLIRQFSLISLPSLSDHFLISLCVGARFTLHVWSHESKIRGWKM